MNTTRPKSAISLISYDSYLLPASIKSYYPYVDEIVLGLDNEDISWSKRKVTINRKKIFDQLREIDTDQKIVIVEENFHRSNNPIVNDTHERNYLKAQCNNDWVFSFDADEVLVNAHDFFINYCPIVQMYDDLELMFTWFLIYKEFDEGYLFIANEDGSLFKKDIQGFTAHRDIHTFTYCRWTNAAKKLLSPLGIEHYSFSRPQKDLDLKINNFGHSAESKNDPFYATQKQVTLQNYHLLKNFKTSGMGEQWPSLVFVSREQMSETLKANARAIYEH